MHTHTYIYTYIYTGGWLIGRAYVYVCVSVMNAFIKICVQLNIFIFSTVGRKAGSGNGKGGLMFSYVWNDAFVCDMTIRIHTLHDLFVCVMTHSYSYVT